MLTSKPHKHVIHPSELIKKDSNKIALWVTEKLTSVLGSFIVFCVCFIVPLLVLPAPTSVKLVAGIILSNWFQAWALPILQRSQNITQVKNDAKADVDHNTLTYLANKVDEISKKLDK